MLTDISMAIRCVPHLPGQRVMCETACSVDGMGRDFPHADHRRQADPTRQQDDRPQRVVCQVIVTSGRRGRRRCIVMPEGGRLSVRRALDGMQLHWSPG
ncbi:MAG: hypothetical protein ACK41Y_07030 [Paracoccus hibiscisoli]